MSIPKKRARILILGISGMVGYNLAWYLRERYSVTGLYFNNFISIPDVHTFHLDLTKKDYVDRMVRMLRPDFTVSACGMNDSRKCAENMKLAEAINAYLPLELAQSSLQNGAKNIFLSCSQIFDGSGKNAKENDKNYSGQAFGRTKLTGESFIRAQTMENTTVRFGKVIGISHFKRPSYFDKLRANLAQGARHVIREEKTYSFISIQKLVKAITLILENEIPAVHRTFHIGGPALKEFDANVMLARALGANHELIVQQKVAGEEEFDGVRVSPTRDYSLDSSLFQKTYNWKPETVEELQASVRDSLTPSKNTWG